MNNKDSKQNRFKLKYLSAAVEQTADNVVIADKDGIIEYVNPAFEETTGYAKEEVLGKTPRILKSGHHKSSFYRTLWETILAGETFKHIITNKKKNGELFDADQTITPLKNARGEITHFISVWKDITERVRYREELEALNKSLQFEKQKFEQILDLEEKIGTFSDPNKLADFIVNGIAGVLEVERCSLMLLDEKTGALAIKGAVGLDHKIMRESKPSLGEGIAGLVAKERKPLLVEVIDTDERVGRENLPSYKTKSFLSVPVLLDHKLLGVVNVTDKRSSESTVFTDFDLKILLWIVRQSAVAIENAQLYKELRYLTVTDPLTNLYNYRHFMRTLDYEIGRFHRFGDPLSLLIMDIDDFKAHNEARGAARGDEILKKIGDILNKHLREVDIICRYASDDFAVILPKTEVAQVKLIVQKITEAVSRLDPAKKITMSFGLASCHQGMTRHDFILKADAALTHAKRHGKNQLYCQEKHNAG